MPLVRRSDLSNLEECLVLEVRSGRKRSFITVIYRSPSQTMEQFSLFRQKWEETIVNINDCSPDISLYIGDFNARNSNWWQNDLTNRQGVEIIDLTSQYNLHQVIDKPTHILPNSASCIDLIFTSANDLIVDSGVYPSLYTRCHHQIVFAKVNFKIYFPLAYERRI